jgi:elongator complex protein 3
MVLANTPLQALWENGEYRSYTDEELKNLIKYVKTIVPEWIRIMRTIRDIPAPNIISGSILSNMRQIVLEELANDGKTCACIRCREVGVNVKNDSKDTPKLYVDKYDASGGTEYFLSYEGSKRRVLHSLLRLRLGKDAVIREVHTYGQQIEVGKRGETQHQGYGRRLIEKAESITKDAGFEKISVISGIGVREYYHKLGYNLDGEYMVKKLVKK